MAEFTLNVQDLEDEAKEYDFVVDPAWIAKALDGSDLRADPNAPKGHLHVRAQLSGTDILVRGTLDARLLTPCVRCLGDALVDVDAPIVSLLSARSQGPRVEPEDVELTPEELDRDFYSGDRVVLDELVREHLLLACPMQPLCREDCAGIDLPEHLRAPRDLGPTLSDGSRVDPRLAPLMKLARKLGQNEE